MNMVIDRFMHTDSVQRKASQPIHVSHPVLVPLMYLERFSDLTGISLSALQEKVDQGHIPTTIIEGRRMIDISPLSKYLLNYEDAPD